MMSLLFFLHLMFAASRVPCTFQPIGPPVLGKTELGQPVVAVPYIVNPEIEGTEPLCGTHIYHI